MFSCCPSATYECSRSLPTRVNTGADPRRMLPVRTSLYLHVLILRYREIFASWYESEEKCQRTGGHLTSVANSFENAFLKDVWNYGSSRYWIGGSYGLITQNEWAWTDDAVFRYTNWCRGRSMVAYHYIIPLKVSKRMSQSRHACP